jgi:hypothetical protein
VVFLILFSCEKNRFSGNQGVAVELKVKHRVRIVQANGCMAHVKENPREGQVVRFIRKQLYGSTRYYRFAEIKLDSGETIVKTANPGEWNLCDGLPEYQE